jgi:hypothetical protein
MQRSFSSRVLRAEQMRALRLASQEVEQGWMRGLKAPALKDWVWMPVLRVVRTWERYLVYGVAAAVEEDIVAVDCV